MSHITIKVRNHVKQRAVERLGLELSTKDIKRLRAIIRNNNCIRFTNYPPRYRDWYKVYFDGKWIIAVYDIVQQEIKTILPIQASPEFKY